MENITNGLEGQEDISHAFMQLSGYNPAPSLPCWKGLNYLMRYLYRKPHVPVMFSQQKVKEPRIVAHHVKGETEITKLHDILEHTSLKA